MINYIEAHRLFWYDQNTGKLYNRISRGSSRRGREAGCLTWQGYREVKICGKIYSSHRIIWLMVHGDWPKEIDHVNHIKDDNRLLNLREVTSLENSRNVKMGRNNVSGLTGVGWNKKTNKWRSRINVKYNSIYLGAFDTIFDAACARKSAENKHSFHPNHGTTPQRKMLKTGEV